MEGPRGRQRGAAEANGVRKQGLRGPTATLLVPEGEAPAEHGLPSDVPGAPVPLPAACFCAVAVEPTRCHEGHPPRDAETLAPGPRRGSPPTPGLTRRTDSAFEEETKKAGEKI